MYIVHCHYQFPIKIFSSFEVYKTLNDYCQLDHKSGIAHSQKKSKGVNAVK